MTKKDNISLSRDTLQIMVDTKQKELDNLTSKFQDAQGEILGMMQSGPHIYKMLIEPLLEMMEDEETMKQYAKLLVLMKRLTIQINAVKKELYVYKSVLDDDSPVHMAGISFDGMEVLSDDPRLS